MQQSDAKLIQQVLQGDPDAFGPLVKKYQKGVHALVWRKIGDFHIAQEVTQDAFLNAYQKLGTLKNHNLFAGWLYVIASNLCLDWLRKNRLPMESLDVEDTNEVDKVSYSQYTVEKRESEADENRREVVKDLLKKLPESERTVMTLHYLGEMTIKTISEFLGVSQNTVKSRLSRARNRLRKEENVVRENLGSFQLPNQFAENIMREVWRMPPVQPPVSKPMIPLALSAASAVLIFLLIGVGAQYLSRFQKPYSLDATSEPTVALIDAVFVVDSPAKPAVRNQPGSSATPGRSPGAGQKPEESVFATVPVDTSDVATPKAQWNQTQGPEGGMVNSLFTTSNGDLYARTDADLYRLSDDGNTWRLLNTNVSVDGSWQMTERDDTLYIVSDTETLTSIDRGETWNVLGTHPKGTLIGTVITDEALYLGLADGVFRSVDAGKSWTSLNDGVLTGKQIRAITAIENTVFVGTDKGLYRRYLDGWEQLKVGDAENIRALASAENRLYVAVGTEAKDQKNFSVSISMTFTYEASLSLYWSTDLGDSWYAIDVPEIGSEKDDEFSMTGQAFSIDSDDDSETEKLSSVKMVAGRESLFVLDGAKSYYLSDTGGTWEAMDSAAPNTAYTSTVVQSNADTLYRSGPFGIQRTTDAGKTWHPFNTGLVRTGIEDLVYVDGALYAKIWGGLVVSYDGGESWAPVRRFPEILTTIMTFNDVLYAKGTKGVVGRTSPQLFRVSVEDNGVTPISGMPSMVMPDYVELIEEKFKSDFSEFSQVELEVNIDEDTELRPEDLDVEDLNDLDMEDLKAAFSETVVENIVELMYGYFGSFAVSGSTYYMEYRQKLFRWKPGMAEWFDTGLVDEGTPFDFSEIIQQQTSIGFKIAVSGETVYVGKRDGHLFQSFDEGETWNDVTTGLPFSVTQFKAVAFAGVTVYVATDKGVVYSSDSVNWHIATDAEGTPLVMEKVAVDGTTVYGAPQQQKQIYQLKENSGTWEPVTPEIPSPVISFAVGSNVFYVGTSGHGVFRYEIPSE